MRVIDVGFPAGRHSQVVHAGAFQTDAAAELRTAYQRFRIPGMCEFLQVRHDVGGLHDVQAGLFHGATIRHQRGCGVLPARTSVRATPPRQPSKMSSDGRYTCVSTSSSPRTEWNRLSCESAACVLPRRQRASTSPLDICRDSQTTMGTWVCRSGAMAYGMPCRYRPRSPNDSP